MTTRAEQIALDKAAEFYDPAKNDYDLAKDPRCLYGWGPPEHGCHCRYGHGCFRAFGHPGKCSDGPADMKCSRVQRPKDWDAVGRTENNK